MNGEVQFVCMAALKNEKRRFKHVSNVSSISPRMAVESVLGESNNRKRISH